MDGSDISKLYHMEFAVTSANPVIDEDEGVSDTLPLVPYPPKLRSSLTMMPITGEDNQNSTFSENWICRDVPEVLLM